LKKKVNNFKKIVPLRITLYFHIREEAVQIRNDHSFWLKGIAVFTPKFQVSDTFRRTFLSMDDRMVDLTREASSVTGVCHSGYYHAAYNEYQNLGDSICTSYSLAPQGIIFDSVVSSVKGYCDAKQWRCGNHVGICDISNIDIFNTIEQKPIAGARNYTNLTTTSNDHYLWNIQHKDDDKNFPFQYILTHKVFENVWIQVNSFIYSNGSVFAPKDLRLVTVVPYNVSPQLKLFINIIAGFGITCCLVSSWLIQNNSSHHIFQSYGPVYHYMLCAGASLQFLGCALGNVDDSYGLGQSYLDSTCNFKVILRCLGFFSVCIVYLIKVLYSILVCMTLVKYSSFCNDLVESSQIWVQVEFEDISPFK